MKKKGEYKNELYYTSHMLAKELLNKPDGFIVIIKGDEEYLIDNLHRKKTQANFDDSTMYWALEIKNGTRGNIR